MTEQEKQEVAERAELEGKILAEAVIPLLRGEIWKASATTSIIMGVLVFSWYRSDFAALRTEMRGLNVHQQQSVYVNPEKGALEKRTEEILESNRLRRLVNVNGMRSVGTAVGGSTSIARTGESPTPSGDGTR